MKSSRRSAVVAVKAVLGVVVFFALMVFIGTGMGHTQSSSRVLPLALVVVVVVVAVILPSALISLAMGRSASRHGGTDAQWFWFPARG